MAFAFGAILRVYAKEASLAQDRAKQVVDAAMTLAKINLNGKSFFKRIDILVAADPDFVDSDCGQTAKLVRGLLRRHDVRSVFVTEVIHGDLFCGLLNYGIAKQVRTARIDYTGIISPEAASYATTDVMSKIACAAHSGARVIDLAFGDLADSIHEGRVANTFCFWQNESLQTVGGFDLKASAVEKDDRQAVYLRGWKEEVGEIFYARSGVEEIIPLLRIIREYGKCVTVIDVEKGKWEIPNLDKDPVAYNRHQEKMRSKTERQAALAFSVNADLSCLQGGLMG